MYCGFKIKRMGCPSCFTPDKDSIEVIQGPHSGFKTTTTSYLNSALFGRHLDRMGASEAAISRIMDHPLGFNVGRMTRYAEALRGAAARIWDILKGLNQAEGFGPEADRAPDIWFETMKGEKGEPLALRDYFGRSALGRKDVEQFVRDYYDERGWKGGWV